MNILFSNVGGVKEGKIRHLYTYMQINFLSYNYSAESNYLQHYMDKFQEKTKYIHIAPLKTSYYK